MVLSINLVKNIFNQNLRYNGGFGVFNENEMMLRRIFGLLIVIFCGNNIRAQMPPTLPKMSNAERDSLTGMSEGFVLLNTSTGCLNYYYQNNWMEVCGQCTPNPQQPRIDSVLYENGIATIYFSPFNPGCEYSIGNDQNDKVLKTNEMPAISRDFTANQLYRFRCQAKSRCGQSDWSNWSPAYSMRPVDYCRGETSYYDARTQKTYTLRSIGRACWMVEPLALDPAHKPDGQSIAVENQTAYYTWEYATQRDVCPDGWQLPSRAHVQHLIAAYRQNDQLNFFKKPYGAYDFKQKKVLESSVHLYWMQEPHSFILSRGGAPEWMEQNSGAGMPVRCVRE